MRFKQLFKSMFTPFDGRSVVSDKTFKGAINNVQLISWLGAFPTKLVMDQRDGQFIYGDYLWVNSTQNQGTYAFDGQTWVYVSHQYLHGKNIPE